MWEESIRLELLALSATKALESYEKGHDRKAFEDIYRDLRIEFPTLSEKEIWQVLGLCAKVRGKSDGKG